MYLNRPALWRYNWHITFGKLKVCSLLIGSFTYCKIIISTALTNTSLSSLNYHFFFVVKTFTVYFLSEVQVYCAMLLTIITIVKVKVTQSCLSLCNPMDYTVHGILHARILEWVAFPFSRGYSQPRDQTQVRSNIWWADISSKRIFRWQISTRKDVQHY